MKKILWPIIRDFLWSIIKRLPYLKALYETRLTHTKIKPKMWFFQKVLGFNKKAYWPVHFTSKVDGIQNILAGVETCPGYSPGCYIHGSGGVVIGDYTQIAPNVGIISSNHDIHDGRVKKNGRVEIGKYSWIGMNAMILPGVKLGDFTVVAAGAVVTKSFEEGYCIIGGNPARLIKHIDKNDCVTYKSKYEYNGYIKSTNFPKFRKKHLTI